MLIDKTAESRKAIREILRIPVGTVKSRLHAALAKLQQMARSDHRDGSG